MGEGKRVEGEGMGAGGREGGMEFRNSFSTFLGASRSVQTQSPSIASRMLVVFVVRHAAFIVSIAINTITAMPSSSPSCP